MFRRQVLDHRHAEINQAGIIAIRIDDKRFDLRFDPSDDMGNDSAGAAERLKEFVTRNAALLHAAGEPASDDCACNHEGSTPVGIVANVLLLRSRFFNTFSR